MSGLFMPTLVLHVLVAVLGLGSILAVAVGAAAIRRVRRDPADAATWLAPLLRFSAISLGIMFVTGILMDAAAGGAFHDRWWFRGSAVLLVLTGILHARARRLARSGFASHAGPDAALRGIERLAYGMSGLIAAITVLMEIKPF